MTRRTAPIVVAVALAALLAACGGSGGGGDDAFADYPTTATIEAASSPVPQQLAPANRYRATITEDCEDYTLRITQPNGDFVWEVSNSPIRIVFVNDVPGGDFLVEQTNPDCTDWTLELTRVSGG
jgi:hypothetical protein